jgi:hypothetical protein
MRHVERTQVEVDSHTALAATERQMPARRSEQNPSGTTSITFLRLGDVQAESSSSLRAYISVYPTACAGRCDRHGRSAGSRGMKSSALRASGRNADHYDVDVL